MPADQLCSSSRVFFLFAGCSDTHTRTDTRAHNVAPAPNPAACVCRAPAAGGPEPGSGGAL